MLSKESKNLQSPVIIRARDISAIISVLIVGAALIYTAYLRGAAPSGNLSVAAFILAGALLTIGYGGGALVDRLGRKYPFLVKSRNHPLAFVVLVPVLGLGMLFLWWERDRVVDDVTTSAKRVLVQVNEQMDQIALP